MTCADRGRRLTGTVIAAARGGAVSAATWAGERIWRAATHPTRASPTTPARIRAVARRWANAIMIHGRRSQHLTPVAAPA
jgi:hypothetical protein